MRIFTAIILLLALQGVAFSATWWVDDDNTTGPWLGTPANPFQFIQSGINAAAPVGDTVRVMPGYYVENINFIGKAVNVMSDQGAWLTTIDGSMPVNPYTALEGWPSRVVSPLTA